MKMVYQTFVETEKPTRWPNLFGGKMWNERRDKRIKIENVKNQQREN